MERRTTGKIVSVKKQWWLKVNTKSLRMGALDGATFPHIIKVKYTVNGVEYTKSKWLGAGIAPPSESENVSVIYNEDKPSKFRIGIWKKLL